MRRGNIALAYVRQGHAKRRDDPLVTECVLAQILRSPRIDRRSRTTFGNRRGEGERPWHAKWTTTKNLVVDAMTRARGVGRRLTFGLLTRYTMAPLDYSSSIKIRLFPNA